MARSLYSGPEAAARKLAEIEAAIALLKVTPHQGSLREEIAPGLRAIPAGRKTVVAFVVDDDAAEVLVLADVQRNKDRNRTEILTSPQYLV